MECTVVVPTVGGRWLDEQLAALAAQTRPAAEVIVVNNGPAGATDDVLARHRAALPMLRLVEDNTVQGPGYARNVGAAHCATDGILFVDDDDVVSSNYVAAMADGLSRADLVSARIRLDQLNPPALRKGWDGLHDSGPMGYFGFLPWTFGGALGIRRTMFETVGGFDVTLLTTEDTDLCWRAQLDAGATFHYVPEATVNYRMRVGPGDAFRQSMAWAEGQVHLFRTYRGRGWRPQGSQLASLLRVARSVHLFAVARNRVDLTVAARHLGSRIGRVRGSIRERCLFL